MRLHHSLTLLVLVAAACGGGGGGTPVDPPGSGQVTGAVIDEADAGVGGVPVTLSRTGAPDRVATTGASGSFSFTSVPVGSWNLSAQTITGFEANGPLTQQVTVTANGSVTAAPIRLRRTGGPGPRHVTISDNEFSPTPINISVGETVRWTNNGLTPHNSTGAAGAWASPNLNTGQTFDRTFNQAGTFQYSCTLHVGMNGTVVVQ